VLHEEGRPPESVFDCVQGITALARGKAHQDARLELEGNAKRLPERVTLLAKGRAFGSPVARLALLETLSFAIFRRSGFRIGGGRVSASAARRACGPARGKH
jgi:hypothetical protein